MLPRDPNDPDYPPLSEERVLRLTHRVRRAAVCTASGRFDRAGDALLEDALEEWSEEVSSQTLSAFVDQVDALRGVGDEASVAMAQAPAGEFLIHLWNRSLDTGEAEVASRGFFDGLDRPPRMLWLEVFARPLPRGASGEEIALLAYVPEQDVARARAGRLATTNGSLCTLEELAPGLSVQLGSLLRGPSAR